jgi:hypothetical protein
MGRRCTRDSSLFFVQPATPKNPVFNVIYEGILAVLRKEAESVLGRTYCPFQNDFVAFYSSIGSPPPFLDIFKGAPGKDTDYLLKHDPLNYDRSWLAPASATADSTLPDS